MTGKVSHLNAPLSHHPDFDDNDDSDDDDGAMITTSMMMMMMMVMMMMITTTTMMTTVKRTLPTNLYFLTLRQVFLMSTSVVLTQPG